MMRRCALASKDTALQIGNRKRCHATAASVLGHASWEGVALLILGRNRVPDVPTISRKVLFAAVCAERHATGFGYSAIFLCLSVTICDFPVSMA